MTKYIINLDLHGGDFAPNSVLKGAEIVLKKYRNIKFQLHSTLNLYEEFNRKFPEVFKNSQWLEADNSISACLLYTSPSPRD